MSAQDFTYPNSDFDRGKTLLSLLGTFWTRVYEGSDQVLSYTSATALNALQTHRDVLALAASMSRYNVPLFHEKNVFPLIFRRSTLNAKNPKVFDLQDAFSGGQRFDRTNNNEQNYALPLPNDLSHVGQIFNRLTFPSVALLADVDYKIDQVHRLIIFRQNPFENNRVFKRTVGDADEEIVLWGFHGQFDYARVFNQFAYALGIKLRTSAAYKEFTNALFSGLLNGGLTTRDLDVALAAICGTPLVIEHEEEVVVIENDARGLFIATDAHVYRFADTATPIVQIGQRVRRGEQLVSGFIVDELFVGNTYLKNTSETIVCCPAASVLLSTDSFEELTTELDESILLSPGNFACTPKRPALAMLALDNGFLPPCFFDNLVFENKDVPLEINTAHDSGYTYVKFNVGGYPADVQRFFDEIHARGVAEANKPANQCLPEQKNGTLAHYLDRRERIMTEPTPATLPATINPMKFLIENVLRNNVFIVKINVSALGQNRLGLYNIRHLRSVLPPQTAALFIFELDPKTDRIPAATYMDENVGVFTGAEPIADNCGEFVTDLGVTLRLISGTCQ